jgi:hypothetical protein
MFKSFYLVLFLIKTILYKTYIDSIMEYFEDIWNYLTQRFHWLVL